MILTNPRAAVKAKVVSKRPRRYEVDTESGVCMIESGTQLVLLEENAQVITAEGEVLEATGRYYRTAETIDPYHLITDYFT